MTPTQHAARRLDRFSIWGARLSVLAMLAMVAGLTYFFVRVWLVDPEAMAELIREFEVGDLTQSLSAPQFWALAVLWGIPDLFGFAMMLLSYRLFRGFRHDGVFTTESATRLRRIGWSIFCIAPARILTTSLGAGFVAATNSPPSGRISLSLTDIDVYAAIIGLLFVSVGHIMIQAVDLSDENKAFV